MTKSNIEVIPGVPSGWEAKELSSVCGLVRNIFMPSSEGSQPYIGLEHIGQGTLSLVDIGKSSDVTSAKFAFKKGQVLFGKLRPYFRKLYRPNFDGVCSTDIFVINGKGGNDNGFIFYFLANQEIIDEATRSSEGTRMPRASWDYLSKLTRPIPPHQEQSSIAKVLSDLDAKIELNQEMNKTLEVIGQALFKHWFVDFEFPNENGKPYKSSGGKMVDSKEGRIPEGWTLGTLNDIAVQIKEQILPLELPDKIFKHYSLEAYDSGKKPLSQKGSEILSNKFTVQNDTVLFSKLNPRIPRLWLVTNVEPDSVCSTEFLVFKPNNMMFSYFYLVLQQTSVLSGLTQMARGTSSSHQRISAKDIFDLAIIIPFEKVIASFEKLVVGLLRKTDENIQEQLMLSQIRDSLLPRLMAGKIRVGVN